MCVCGIGIPARGGGRLFGECKGCKIVLMWKWGVFPLGVAAGRGEQEFVCYRHKT